MLGVASGQEVQVHVVAYHSRSHDGIVLVVRGELREQIVDLAVDDRVLFQPADLVLLCLDLQEAAAVIHDLQPVAIGDFAYAIGDGGDTIMKIRLTRGDVDRFVMLRVEAAAAADKRESDYGPSPGRNGKPSMAQ
jgi:hypothetical protein